MAKDSTIVRGPCYCGSVDFERVRVRQRNGEVYMTEFVSCHVCGVMYHRPDQPKPIEKMTPERRDFLKRIGWLK
ncbi:MAG: hypothetical protein K8R60_06835 [Burkholderiales bacterium]|nr:hypothetical protein [Burkholderiales bacterium]